MNGSAVSFLWLIPFFPLAGALINGLLAASTSHRPHGPNRALVAWIACLAPAASFAVTVAGFFSLRAMEPAERLLTQRLFTWIRAGDLTVDLGFLFDPLSSAMLLFVTGIGFLIHLYSVGYMSHDRGFARYFAYLNLFMFAMILLVLGDSLPVLFIGWEGVGLCSYLLIGFWHEDPEKAKAGMKAFVVNRIGDFGFLLGMFLIFWTLREGGTPTLAFAGMKEQAYLLGGAATAIGLLLFLGAAGKSAQIPLYVWLPDAMAGPTPVSALIHAATMVTSGVYMVTRMSFLYDLAPAALAVVAVVGALTALLAATIGLTQFDIKKVLAYSTVSQLGFMFLGAGVGAYAAGMFHVVTHAFFKALLFLGAGSVIHALSGEQDIRKMGGLFRKIPVTSRTFLVAWLAICGIFPFAGFFSKDEILWKAFDTGNVLLPGGGLLLWALAATAALMTSFYMFRSYYMTFSGSYRGNEGGHGHGHEGGHAHTPHESPRTMTWVLAILAVLALVGGYIGLPHLWHLPNLFEHWLEPAFEGSAHAITWAGHAHGLEWGLMGLSIAIAFVGFFLARWLYRDARSPIPAKVLANPNKVVRGVHRWVFHKYYVDELYDRIVIRPSLALSVFLARFDIGAIDGLVNLAGRIGRFFGAFNGWIDRTFVDGAVNLVGDAIVWGGRVLRKTQTGRVQAYVYGLVAGSLILVVAAWLMTA